MATNYDALLNDIKRELPALQKLKEKIDSHWGEEDNIYRFYHQSFKVYRLQGYTMEAYDLIVTIGGERKINEWFKKIAKKGTKEKFDESHNQAWLRHTRPIVEAFYHAKYFIAMLCKYGNELESAPSVMPSGWAAILYLYNMR